MYNKILFTLLEFSRKRIVRSSFYYTGFIEGAVFVGAITKEEGEQLKQKCFSPLNFLEKLEKDDKHDVIVSEGCLEGEA